MKLARLLFAVLTACIGQRDGTMTEHAASTGELVYVLSGDSVVVLASARSQAVDATWRADTLVAFDATMYVFFDNDSAYRVSEYVSRAAANPEETYVTSITPWFASQDAEVVHLASSGNDSIYSAWYYSNGNLIPLGILGIKALEELMLADNPRVEVRSDVLGDLIYVDGEYMSETIDTVVIEPGQRHFLLKDPLNGNKLCSWSVVLIEAQKMCIHCDRVRHTTVPCPVKPHSR